MEALEFNRNVLPLLLLLVVRAVLKFPHSEVNAQKPQPLEATEEELPLSVVPALKPLLSVEAALTHLLSVDSAHKLPRDVVPPQRLPFSVVTAAPHHRLLKVVVPQAPQTDVSPLLPLIDVMPLQDLVALMVPQDPIAAPVQADPNKRAEVSRDVEHQIKLLLLDEVAHRGLPEVAPELKDPLADPSTSMAVE